MNKGGLTFILGEYMSLLKQDNIDINNAYKYLNGDGIDYSSEPGHIPTPMLSYSTAAIFAAKHFDSLHNRQFDSLNHEDRQEAYKYINAYRIFSGNDIFIKENSEFLNSAKEADIIEITKYAINIHKDKVVSIF